MVRLGVPEDQPLAVQQWQGLIAINYPARKYGLNRHVTITEAKKLCPEIICQHVATWREGDEKWAYHEDSFKNMATHKVSLDPYRLESRRILKTIKDTLPAAPIQRVEKASIDEVFLDLSAQVRQLLLERYPELDGPAPYDDPTEKLPKPPTTALEWKADSLVDLDDGAEAEEEDPDWDDIAMLIGSEIVRDVRAAIREKLQYTCSAGIARNKMIAKLGSGHHKPNKQTVVRNRAIAHFLSGFKFTKIRNLGGKLGDEIVSLFNTDSVSELLEVSQEQLMNKLHPDTGLWLYNTIRGEDSSEVNPRTQIKSMLSAKSFRPSINSFEVGVRWLRIFVADIFSRLVEEGVLENKRRPKTINLHHRTGGQTRSKQAPVPQGKRMDETLLFDLAKNLLAQVVVDGRAWPCANLSLSVGGFEDGPTGNKGIGGFLVRGDEARAMLDGERHRHDSRDVNTPPPDKRRRLDDNASGALHRFFVPRSDSRPESDQNEDDELVDESAELGDKHDSTKDPQDQYGVEDSMPAVTGDLDPHAFPPSNQEVSVLSEAQTPRQGSLKQSGIEEYFCSRCNARLPISERTEHEDFHYAQDLSNELREEDTRHESPALQPSKAPPSKTHPKGRGRPPASTVKRTEKGQKTLAFGKG